MIYLILRGYLYVILLVIKPIMAMNMIMMNFHAYNDFNKVVVINKMLIIIQSQCFWFVRSDITKVPIYIMKFF